MEGCLDRMDLCNSKCPKWANAKKCCFCVPIRKGVTIFGYVHLVLALLSFPVLMFLLVKHLTLEKAEPDPEAQIDPTLHLPLTIILVVVDVIMAVVLLIGAHRKKKLLLKIYFYFGVLFQLATLCIDLVFFDFHEYAGNVVYFFDFCLNIYLLYLVYNTIHLIEESSEVQYVAYLEPRYLP